MTPDRCTCGPVWVYEPGCGTPHRETGMCEWCEDAENRDRLEAFAEGEPLDADDLEALWAECAPLRWGGQP